MKKQTAERVTVGLYLAFLLCMCLGTFLIPKGDFSQTEKRYLAKFPEPSWSSISSGEWGEQLETWMADHIPGRSFFVGLDAYKALLLGQQEAADIRLHDGRLVEAPVTVKETSLEKNLQIIRNFADQVEAPVTLALVPSAGWAAGLDGWQDDTILGEIYSRAGVNTLDLTELYRGRPELFYRTDHHWTSEGAALGYQAIARYFGLTPTENFQIERIPNCFQGSTYSRSALWLTKPEDLELWHGSEAITVTNSDSQEPHSVFYRDRLNEADKYTVFLDGNHATVTLHNPEKSGKLLVIRDSYSNCLGPFLAESWGEVELIDLRYFRFPVSAIAEDADQILILYSIGNFLTDANIVLLR